MPLARGCEKLIYFVNRNSGDYAYGILTIGVGLPEVLGEVDDATRTRAFVVAKFASAAQIVMTPGRVTVHEIYHLLGCGHFDMPDCYRRIQDFKRAKQRLQNEDRLQTD